MASRTASPCSQRPNSLPARLSHHAVTQRVHVVPGDGDDAHVEELDVGRRLAEDLLHHLQRMRALHLVAEEPARALVDERALVALGGRLVLAAFDVVLHPVERRGPSDEAQLVGLEVEEDGVADDVAVVVAGDELLGLVHLERGETVDTEIRQHLERVRALDVEVRHVMRLIEERARGSPGCLLVSPVRKFRRHHGERVRTDLRIPQHVHGVPGLLQCCLQVLFCHDCAHVLPCNDVTDVMMVTCLDV